MEGVIYLAMLGVAAIIGAIIGTLVVLLLSFTSLSPLIIGGSVGDIYVVPLIAAFITILLYPIPYERHSGLTLKETSCLAGLFIGNIVAGAFIAASGAFPICKVDSWSSLSAALESLLAVGVHALALTMATAIGVAIVIKLAEQAKEYISAVAPITKEKVPIIADDKVKVDKGTGLVMCCTFGDELDIYWQQKHNLPMKIIIDQDGRMNLHPPHGQKERAWIPVSGHWDDTIGGTVIQEIEEWIPVSATRMTGDRASQMTKEDVIPPHPGVIPARDAGIYN
ncbi:unnamed protein product [Parnassius apollo]|uniref:valine--tRNA ligase n=1 Tax=Parnassius apollo TaxID=110799 RepID=A0A8S3Y9G1_PARAO|nr:unnamed protein product [Parnassius apollo]